MSTEATKRVRDHDGWRYATPLTPAEASEAEARAGDGAGALVAEAIDELLAYVQDEIEELAACNTPCGMCDPYALARQLRAIKENIGF